MRRQREYTEEVHLRGASLQDPDKRWSKQQHLQSHTDASGPTRSATAAETLGGSRAPPAASFRFRPLRMFGRGLWRLGRLVRVGRRRGPRGPPLGSLSCTMLAEQLEDGIELAEEPALGGSLALALHGRAPERNEELSSSGLARFPLQLTPVQLQLEQDDSHRHKGYALHRHYGFATRSNHHPSLAADASEEAHLHSKGSWRSILLGQGHNTNECEHSKQSLRDAASSPAVPDQHAEVRAGSEHYRDHSVQHLLAIGSRQWGNNSWWDGRSLLKVKVYEYAVYVNPTKTHHHLSKHLPGSRSLDAQHQMHHLSSSASSSGSSGLVPLSTSAAAAVAGGHDSLCDSLVAAQGVPMSLTIRASRNLPVHMLSQEFEQILRRRHAKVGGAADDPALREVVQYFTAQRLPSCVLTSAAAGSGSSSGLAVRKGSTITFNRHEGGELVASAGSCVLGRVVSPKVCEALFDLYLGEQPVSKRAKAVAGENLARLLSMPEPSSTSTSDSSTSTATGIGALTGAWHRHHAGAGAGHSSGMGHAHHSGYQYVPKQGERLVCGPGASLSACVVEVV